MGRAVVAAFAWMLLVQAAWAQAILPQAETQFTDSNGAPLAAGQVFTYVPGTTTPATTWQDSGLTTANTNPVVLDSAGRARIWGNQCYREVVEDLNSVLIWDQVTCAPLSIVNVTGSGAVVLQMSPTIDTPTLTSPTISGGMTVTSGNSIINAIYGGLASGTLTLGSSVSGVPATSLQLQGSVAILGANNGVTQLQVGTGSSSAGQINLVNQSATNSEDLIAASGASGFATFPGGTYTLAGLGLSQTFSGTQTFSSGVTMSGLSTSNQTSLVAIGGGGVLSTQSTTGTGAAVLATTATINTPLLNAPTAENLPNDAGTDYVCFDSGNSNVTMHSTACVSSDERLKHDWSYDVPGLSAIMALQPGTYDWLDVVAAQDGRQLGLRAQDVQKVLPIDVRADGDRTITLQDGSTRQVDNTLSLDYSKLTLPLIVAVQEQQWEIRGLMAALAVMTGGLMIFGIWVYRRA